MNVMIMIVVLIIFPSFSSAQEPVAAPSGQPVYNTNFIDGSAAITIDGDLTDWEGIGASPTPMTSHQICDAAYSGESDLSASFRAFADRDFLYVAVEVTDDVPLFGESSRDFSRGFNDDGVEFKIEGNFSGAIGLSEVKNAIIRVVQYEPGKVRLEGEIWQFYQIPYGWESLGVHAGLQQHEGGYNAEICIPANLFGVEQFREGTDIQLNVGVIDDDDEGIFEDEICWAPSTEDTTTNLCKGSGVISLSTAKEGIQSPAKPAAPSAYYPATIETSAKDQLIITLKEQSPGRGMAKETLTKDVPSLQSKLNEVRQRGGDRRELVAVASHILVRLRKELNEDALQDAVNILEPECKTSPFIQTWFEIKIGALAADYFMAQNPGALSEEALSNTLRIFGATGTREALRIAGVKRTEAGNCDLALQYHRRILDLDPSPLERGAAYYNLGYNYKENASKKYKQREKEYQEWHRSYMQKPSIRYDSIKVECQAELDKSIEWHEKVIEMADQTPLLRKVAISYHELGDLYLGKGKIQEAISMFKILIEKYSKIDWNKFEYLPMGRRNAWFIAEALFRLAGISAREGNEAEAREYYNRVIQEYPQSNYSEWAKTQLWQMDLVKRNYK